MPKHCNHLSTQRRTARRRTARRQTARRQTARRQTARRQTARRQTARRWSRKSYFAQNGHSGATAVAIDTNFDDQLRTNPKSYFFTANTVYAAVDVLLKRGLVNANTYFVFDLDGTLVQSNGDRVRENEVLLPTLDLFLVQNMLLNIQGAGARAFILTGRGAPRDPEKDDQIKRDTRKALTGLGLKFDYVLFESFDKAQKLWTLLQNSERPDWVKAATIYYFDDFLVGGAGNVVFNLRAKGVTAHGIKVEMADESLNTILLEEHEKKLYRQHLAPGVDMSLFSGLIQ